MGRPSNTLRPSRTPPSTITLAQRQKLEHRLSPMRSNNDRHVGESLPPPPTPRYAKDRMLESQTKPVGPGYAMKSQDTQERFLVS